MGIFRSNYSSQIKKKNNIKLMILNMNVARIRKYILLDPSDLKKKDLN